MGDYTLEIVRQIWHDKNGDRVEVGPDSDGLGLVEIRHRDMYSKITARITLEPDAASMVAAAMLACAKELKAVE